MSDERTTIDLAALEPEMPVVKLPKRLGGRVVDVHPVDGIGMQLHRDARLLYQRTKDESGIGDESGFYKLAAHLLPDATPEEVNGLAPAVVGSVIAMALGQVEAVEAVLKNGAGPSQSESAATAPRSRSRRSTR